MVRDRPEYARPIPRPATPHDGIASHGGTAANSVAVVSGSVSWFFIR